MSGLVDRLLDLVYPPKCPFCQKILSEPEERTCQSCRTSLTEGRSGKRQGDWFSGCFFALGYENTVRDAILRYKFEGCRYYAKAFGQILTRSIQANAPPFEVLSWAPVSRARKKQRGYDQSWLLCREVGQALGVQPIRTLEKVRNNPPQSGLTSLRDRQENVKNVYRVPDPKQVEGKRILLIDDIVTTGSTVSACSRALLQAGAESVWCAVLAGTVLDDVT